ncbi:unnamed protein product (macronuclear) [Paramecium tetraurelia]|uniref:Chromosome undetermined scaffold_1, whole genome shotgun sequence n=1 Tax=Paramecium tetraurelia TaxID=5888 RepID=Q6BGC5_PARTE|nr:Kelch repeat-containing protein [Paramecium tetraurelia strain d4-2]XP_001423407.1 uncharacterized protein GSPATT00000444001 [Paramecium tetraurelia]CAH03295.1 Kelch repeat-containing protein, putative [Paramecium tetraurelia]CAK56009.1 unnamed protein product [Paramecium tetraurelia]|eukprot:XP_001423407.1 hypothetical protein (macronuclear) [Paramecium tetraurelia strain d4-2]
MYSNRSHTYRKNDSLKLYPASPTESHLQESEYKYLPLITKVNQEQLDPKWQECKIDGKNLLPRSSSSITILNNHLYLYGGYQYAEGIMKDFYKLNLNAQTYVWQKIKCDYEPGPRCRHSICSYLDNIYLFGGQVADSISTNEIFIHDVKKQQWQKLEINKTYPSPLDNHCATLYNDQWIIFGGFYGGNECKHSNDLFSFNFNENRWMKLNKQKGMEPAPRDGSSITSHNQSVYIFGGKNGDKRYNDLWQFNMLTLQWIFIGIDSLNEDLRTRSGHSLISYQNKLILFGGIHDVTWELDDLHSFNVDIQKWKTINADTSRRKEAEVPSPTKTNRNQPRQQKPRRGPILLRPLSLRKSPSPSPNKLRPGSQSQYSSYSINNNPNNFASPELSQYQSNQNNQNNSTVHTTLNNVQERKRWEQKKKKTAMLKLFEVENREIMNFQDDCNVTEKLKTSIILIGNPKQDLKLKKGILTEFGQQIISKFLLPITGGQNVINGKKPCARDGHSVAVFNDFMIVFGGDRHTMSFNDLYFLNLSHF